MTRAMIKILLTRIIVFAAITIAVLLSMNYVTNQRIEMQKQSEMQKTLGIVLKADRYREMNISSYHENYPTIQAAYAAYDTKDIPIGYVIDVVQNTPSGEMHTRMGFSPDGETLSALLVVSPDDADIQTGDFLDQFNAIRVPVALLSDLPDTAAASNDYPPIAGLQDGIYMEVLKDEDEDGYKDYVQMVITKGRISKVTWDAVQVDGGNNRAKASVNGEFVLPDNTVIWAAQAYAMQNKLIEVQDPSKIAIKSDGTTEIVPTVTMNVNAFLRLANKCIEDSKNGLTSSIDSPTVTPTATPTATPTGNGKTTPTGSPAVTDAPQETQGATGAPVETDIAVTMADPESSDAYTGSEDGLVMNDQGNTQADSIDGLPASEIRTKINEAPGNPESSRAVVSSVNQAYLFLNYYLEGRKQ